MAPAHGWSGDRHCHQPLIQPRNWMQVLEVGPFLLRWTSEEPQNKVINQVAFSTGSEEAAWTFEFLFVILFCWVRRVFISDKTNSVQEVVLKYARCAYLRGPSHCCKTLICNICRNFIIRVLKTILDLVVNNIDLIYPLTFFSFFVHLCCLLEMLLVSKVWVFFHVANNCVKSYIYFFRGTITFHKWWPFLLS